MRILTLNYEFPPIGGGGSPVSYELGRELVAQGHQVDVVTMGFDGLPAREVVDGINVFGCRACASGARSARPTRWPRSCSRRCPELRGSPPARNYDVNHTHFIVPTGLLARLLKTWTGLPFVVTMHGSDVPGYNPDRFGLQHRLLGPLWKWILHGADQLISPSQFLRKLVDQRPHGRPISIIPNGFRYERFRADLPKERRILLVSRMLPRKGVQYLLAALPRPRSPGLRGRHRRRRPLSADAQADGRGARPAGAGSGDGWTTTRPSSRNSTSARRSSPSPRRPRTFRPCCWRRWRRARRS